MPSPQRPESADLRATDLPVAAPDAQGQRIGGWALSQLRAPLAHKPNRPPQERAGAGGDLPQVVDDLALDCSRRSCFAGGQGSTPGIIVGDKTDGSVGQLRLAR